MVDDIFDAVGAMAKESIRKNKIWDKQAQIDSVTKRECGNCGHWMKSTCKLEKERGQFKSMNTVACEDFDRESYVDKLILESETKLKELLGGE